jgi:anti-sigma B factor antagonist
MEFHGHATQPGVIVLVADKQLDSYDSAGLVKDLQRAIDAGAHTLVVDCSRLGHVSTIAVCTLLTLHKRLVEHASELRLAAVQPPLRRVLGLTRLDQVFRLFTAVDEAVEAPRQPAAPTPTFRRT